MTLPLIESGEPYTVEECCRCGEQNAKGTRYVRTGRVIFKCEQCGKSNDLGYLEEAHIKQVASKQGFEKATENRDRFWRENQEKQAIEYSKAIEGMDVNAHEIMSIDYATKKWRFEERHPLP